MTSGFRLTAIAEDELGDISNYTLKHWGSVKATTYVESLRARVRWLTENPQLGSIRAELHADVRSFPEGAHVIFYRIEGEQLVVLRIKHRASDMKIGWEELQ